MGLVYVIPKEKNPWVQVQVHNHRWRQKLHHTKSTNSIQIQYVWAPTVAFIPIWCTVLRSFQQATLRDCQLQWVRSSLSQVNGVRWVRLFFLATLWQLLICIYLPYLSEGNLLAQQLLHKNRLHITNHSHSRTPFWANPVATVPCQPYGHFGQHMPFSVVGKTWSAWYAGVTGCRVKPLSIWQWHTKTIDFW